MRLAYLLCVGTAGGFAAILVASSPVAVAVLCFASSAALLALLVDSGERRVSFRRAFRDSPGRRL